VKKKNTIIVVVTAGYLLAALAVLGIGMVLVPEGDRTQASWYRLLWTEVLILLVYLPVFSFFNAADSDDAHRRATIGVLPGAKIVILFYAFISFSLMMLNAYHNGEYFSDRFHLTAQIIITFVMGTIFTLMSVSYTTAATGLKKTFPLSNSPNELCDQLRGVEGRLKARNLGTDWVPVTQSLKKLRETIQYSLPHVGKIVENPAYREFANSIIAIAERIRDLEGKAEEIDIVQIRIFEITNRAISISNKTFCK
jgi:hypothetical protein